MSKRDEERLNQLEKDMILGKVPLDNQREYEELAQKVDGSAK